MSNVKHSWVDPIVPDEEDRLAYLRYKHENGQLNRQYEIRNVNDNATTVIAFQEDPNITPVVGGEAIRVVLRDCGNDTYSTDYDLISLTSEIIDCTNPIPNEAPTDIALTDNYVFEDSPVGTVIGTLSTLDPNINDTHTYSIILDVDNKFIISGDKLRLKNLVNHDAMLSHDVTIRTTDQGLLFYDKIFTIYVAPASEFVNDKATLFQGDTITKDMVGPPTSEILPGNGSFAMSTWVKKDNPSFSNSKAVQFNGTDQYGDTGINTDFTGSGDFSISLWYKGTNPSYIVSQAHTLGPYSSDFIIGGGGGLFWMRTEVLGSVASINDNQWHNIILSWNSVAETYDGYLDGVNIGTSAVVSGYGGTGPLTLCSRGDFTTSFNQGDIDEFSVWSKALNNSDASEIYNSGVTTNLNVHSQSANLTHWWRMGDDPSDTDVLLIDQKGSNNITLVGNPPIVASTLPGSGPSMGTFTNVSCVDFDGINGSMSIANPSNYHFNNGVNDTAFTISAWVKMNDATTFRIACKGDAADRELLFTTSASDNLIAILYTDGANNLYQKSDVVVTADEGSWTHYAVTYDGSETAGGITLYRNGVVFASSDFSSGTYSGLNNSGDNMLIGRFEGISGEYANGQMDEISFYSSELTGAEIATLYSAGNATDLSTTSDILSWHRMGDDDIAPTILDQIGSNHGTLSGGATIVASTLPATGTTSDFKTLVVLHQDPSGTVVVPEVTSIPNLVAWHEAWRSGSTLDTGGLVDQWTDLSGNGNHFTQTGVARPNLISDGGSGASNRPVIRFDGATQSMIAPATITGTTARTIFIVSRANISNSGAMWAAFDGATVSGNGYDITPETGIRVRGGNRIFDQDSVDPTAFSVTTTRDIINNNVGATEAWINGVSLNQTSVDEQLLLTGNGNSQIGRSQTGTYFNGDIAEIIIYDRDLTDPERVAIEQYLSNKWTNGIDPLVSMGEPKAELRWNESDTFQMRYFNGATTETLQTVDNYGDDVYHNVMGRYNSISGDIELFVDADLKDSTNDIIVASGTGLARVGSFNGVDKFYDGLMDELSIWDNAADPADIYNGGYSQDLLTNVNLTGNRLWLRLGDPNDDYNTIEGIKDRSGHSYDFTANSMSNSNCVNDAVPTLNSSFIDQTSVELNGVDQFMGISADEDGDLFKIGAGTIGYPMTISTWFKLTAPATSSDYVFNLAGESSVNDFIRLRYVGTTLRLEQRNETSGSITSVLSTTVVSPTTVNDWVHVAICFVSPTETRIKVNGGATIVDSGREFLNKELLSNFTIGCIKYFSGSNVGYTSMISGDTAVWNTTLSDDAMVEIYNSGKGYDMRINGTDYTQNGNLQAFWMMGDRSSDMFPTISDASGNNLALAMVLFHPDADGFVVDAP